MRGSEGKNNHCGILVFLHLKGVIKCPFLCFSAGVDEGEGTHVSVGMNLMKGPHDDKLEQSGHWPLQGIFTIELLNRRFDTNHRVHHLVFFNKYANNTNINRVLDGTFAPTGWSDREFISHETIFHQGDIDYVENNALYFRITYEASHLKNHDQYRPILKLSNFASIMLENRAVLICEFFAFEEGYQMCLRVDGAGFSSNEGTYVSVGLHVMKGPHDDKLKQSGHWPLRGAFQIELLNQHNDNNHHTNWLLFTKHKCSKILRPVNDGIAEGCTISKFIPHHSLHQNNYFMNDALYFRITYDNIVVIDRPPCVLLPV